MKEVTIPATVEEKEVTIPRTVKGRLEFIQSPESSFILEGRMGTRASRITFILIAGKAEDQITDEEMERAIGVSCRAGGKGYPSFYSALRRVERQYAIIWSRPHGANYIKCLPEEEKLGWARTKKTSCNKLSNRARAALTSLKQDELTPESRVHAAAMQNQMAIVALVTSSESTKAIEAQSPQAIIVPTRTSEIKAVHQNLVNLILGMAEGPREAESPSL